MWLLLYFVILLTLLAMIIIPYIHFRRRPSKVQQLEQQVAELQQQVDELKKDKE